MAFTLEIKTKGLFNNKKVDFEQLLKNCGLEFGHMNGFYILEDGMEEQTAVLYNPKRMGRGVFFDGRKMEEGEVKLSYNIPTTESDITDFINVVKEVERQLKKVDMFCVEEKRKYTVAQLIENKGNMVQFSRMKLNEFCSNKAYVSYILTLTRWPLELTEEMVKKFATCTDLQEFEQILHDKQNIDVYYAKPRLMQKQTGEIGAFYTFTEDCVSVFPVKAEGFLNLEQIKVDEYFIRYFVLSEERLMEGFYNYDKFIQYMMENGAEFYDRSHILTPSVTKEQLEELTERTRE